MCQCLWEVLKCPGKVVCCCCKCALNMFLGIFCSVVVLLVIIGLIVYFTVYHNKDKGGEENMKNLRTLATVAPTTFRQLFKVPVDM